VGSSFVADAVAKVGPAVVRIDIKKEVSNPIGGIFGMGPPLQEQQGLGATSRSCGPAAVREVPIGCLGSCGMTHRH
jgi:S1-C subfamily serine protease